MESDVCKLCLKSKTDLMPVTKEISAEGSDDNCSYEQLISKLLDRNGTVSICPRYVKYLNKTLDLFLVPPIRYN